MIIYKCQCGEELAMTENTEKSRDEKRNWKERHNEKVNGRFNVGHGWLRLVVKRGKYA